MRGYAYALLPLVVLLAAALASLASAETLQPVIVNATGNYTFVPGMGALVEKLDETTFLIMDPNPNDTLWAGVLLDNIVTFYGEIAVRADRQVAFCVPGGCIQANMSIIKVGPEGFEVSVGAVSLTGDQVAVALPTNVSEATIKLIILAEEKLIKKKMSTGQPLASFSGSTPPAQKYVVNLKEGMKVYVKITNVGGSSHDVYIFFPGHKYWWWAKNYKGNYWVHVYSKCKADPTKCVKIWYPATTAKFTAPLSGNYLFVVVKFAKDGPFTLQVNVEGQNTPTYTPPQPTYTPPPPPPPVTVTQTVTKTQVVTQTKVQPITVPSPVPIQVQQKEAAGAADVLNVLSGKSSSTTILVAIALIVIALAAVLAARKR